VFAAGDYLNHDLAGYHVPVCADIEGLEAVWVDEADDRINPLGAKGIGELGIVGRDPDRQVHLKSFLRWIATDRVGSQTIHGPRHPDTGCGGLDS
jgi:hypothetical protein